ncbi:peptidylprolyl isomerase [Fulvivirga sp. M361]|uniref:peptidylprolyl isomerase n=1 Tax=Fulvivirga sp. M361 TaxID=2594266 RepID=UPI001628DB75|nr:peptidylprolyl isomerase [Fulvivirga sp. M361]
MLLLEKVFSGPLWLVIFVVFVSACQHEADKIETTGYNKFSDPVIAHIYDYQDQRDTKALLAFFNEEDTDYREAAALAFGSVQDTAAIRPLGFLLNDEAARVRRAAAYALGQMHDTQAIDLLSDALVVEDSAFVRKELMEALGKVITINKIHLLLQVKVSSDLEKEGLAWGLYRAGIRNVHDGVCIDVALSLLDTVNTYQTRLGAAHFFSRSPNLSLVGREGLLVRAAVNDPSPHVRMAATSALRKAVSPKVGQKLVEVISKDPDYRVRVNSIRAMENLRHDQVNKRLWELLEDENSNVAVAAAELLATQSSPFDQQQILSVTNRRVKSLLLAGMLRVAGNQEEVISTIKNEYENTSAPYYKAGLLRALGNSIHSTLFLKERVMEESSKPIRTAAIEALIKIRTDENFPESSQSMFAQLFKEIISTGDIGAVALISNAYLNKELNFQRAYKDLEFLSVVKAKLSLPKDNEALQVLNKVIGYFKEEEPEETRNTFNHPINWDEIRKIKKDQKMLVSTEKGDVVLRLLVEKAPGSVLNFMSLADSGYFNGKNFHRVVPNFVIQGGCNRGDGFGGEAYSIRSELGLKRYGEGAVGMASAGKDTEGTQWFITHSPTPHLDGRYTLFAQVEDGMEVVHNVEVGNKIIEIKKLD